MLLFPHIAQTVIIALMIVIPIGIIYKRAGFSPLWAGLVLLPGFGLFLISLQLALLDWPNQIKSPEDLQD